MKTKVNLILLLSILFLTSCNSNRSNNIEKEDLPALIFLESKLKLWVDSGYYDGLAVRIVKDNKTFFESYQGGFTDTTSLHIASAGKWVASATVAALVDEGKLSWDDKVSKYLPEFNDGKGEATLRQLFSHTAGYPDYQPEGKPRDMYQTLEESVANIVVLPADTLPGSLFRYGGLAMQVAGRMAEIATGKDWETIFQEKIAQPLGMKQSYFVPVSQEPGFNPTLGGAMKTSLADFIKFLSMISNNGVYDGKQILSAKAIGEIEADQIGQAYVKQPEYVELLRQNSHNGVYGLGVWREEIDDNNKVTLISSPGWAGAYPWIDRKNNLYGFILAKVNVGKANAEGFSSFRASPVLPIIARDAVAEMNYPKGLKSGKLNIGGAQLYYEEMGSGTPVIFIHGHSLDHKMWDLQFFEFSKKYRAIRYDLRGYGYSSAQDEMTQFTHVEDLVKFMDALGIEKAHIVGLSLGGYIGADMLGWYPERMLSAVLASGNVRRMPKPSQPMDEEEAERRNEEIVVLKKRGVDAMKVEWFNGLMKSGGTNKEIMRRPLWNMVYAWDAWQPLHKEVRVIAGDDAYDELKVKHPKLPVMILEGRSENNRFSNNPEILSYLPNGRLVVAEDCGHMLNMEQPEVFNGLVISFINENNK